MLGDRAVILLRVFLGGVQVAMYAVSQTLPVYL